MAQEYIVSKLILADKISVPPPTNSDVIWGGSNNNSTAPATISYTRIGNVVTMTFYSPLNLITMANNDTFLVCDFEVPAGFRPAGALPYYFPTQVVINNQVSADPFSLVYDDITKKFKIIRNASDGFFAAGLQVTIPTTSISYISL